MHAPQFLQLNAECGGVIDTVLLRKTIKAQGSDWADLLDARCPHVFSSLAVFVSSAHIEQMNALVAAVERIVHLPNWCEQDSDASLGVFYGYDFHLDENGAHLIEINTNAGGAFLNALLLQSQQADACESDIVAMFRHEWQLRQGGTPLKTIAIVDEQPEQQYLYPEFILAQRLFERVGIQAHIVDPTRLQVRENGVYLDTQKIDLIYNRLTDFSLEQYAGLLAAHHHGQVLITPSPAHYARYADKRNLVRLSDANLLRKLRVDEADIAVLQACLPHTVMVHPEMAEMLWTQRKQWFFKPVSGYGSKGAYRGEKLTKRVFAEIMQGGYIAQHLLAPGERTYCPDGEEKQSLKFDIRCYVYNCRIQIVAARLYQGQTTNFRTPGGGFSLVRVS
ncbi:MAG: hypothetical protein PHY62_05230 [Gallionella sp.]|nr:hypothetical protein [Gallionella sp.]